MKKILAMVLAMMLVLSMSAAFAATDPTVNEGVTDNKYTDITQFTITKTYELRDGSASDANSPAEDFIFTVLSDEDNAPTYDEQGGALAEGETIPVITIKGNDGEDAADTAVLEYNEGEAGSETKSKELTVYLPEYNHVGVYTYKIRETANNKAGVEYLTDIITVTVTVLNSENGEHDLRVVAVSLKDDSDKKTYSFDDNSYAAGDLTVSKTVTGTLGDHDKTYWMTVNFESDMDVTASVMNGNDELTWTPADGKWTASTRIAVVEGTPVTIKNIPFGVKYTVVEDSYASENYDAAQYKVNGASEVATMTAEEMNTNSEAVEVINNKDGDIATGIVLDNAPYMILMALVVVAGAALIVKRASANR